MRLFRQRRRGDLLGHVHAGVRAPVPITSLIMMLISCAPSLSRCWRCSLARLSAAAALLVIAVLLGARAAGAVEPVVLHAVGNVTVEGAVIVMRTLRASVDVDALALRLFSLSALASRIGAVQAAVARAEGRIAVVACAVAACENGGSCVAGATSVSRACAAGFTGMRC